MKRCPSCNRTYTDVSLNFCLEDGSPLIADGGPSDPHATVRYPPTRTTSEPPPTEVYRPGQQPVPNQVQPASQPRPHAGQWAPSPPVRTQKKSGAVWWILGGIAVVGVIGVGLIIMIVAMASLSAKGNLNTSERNANRGVVTDTPSNINSDTSNLPNSYVDDFSIEKWRTGNFEYGDIWYGDGEYHMRAKERTYLVMYAPSGDYNTENAIVRVTARSADGIGPNSGYGLIVHGQKSSNNELEDYALLIYTGDEPQYEIVMHKGGNQSTLVSWTKTSLLRSGTNSNQLEIRIKGDQLSFYINGRYLTRLTDTENFRRGVAGLYTSETSEVVFDDLTIERADSSTK